MKTHAAISLRSRLYNFRLPGILNSPWDSIGTLNVDEGVVLIDNKSKILQLQSILQIQNMRLRPAFLWNNMRPAFFKRVSIPKREIHVLAPKCETRVQSVPGRDSRVPTTQREVCVLKQTLPKCEAQTRVSSQKRKVHVQSGIFLKHTKLKSPHPKGFEARPLDTPATNLRDCLIKKKSVNQITPQCCYEWLIIAVLLECHCNSHTSKLLVFNRL